MVGFNQVAEVEMAAKDYEPTTLLNGNSRPAADRDGHAAGRRPEDRGARSGPTAPATRSRPISQAMGMETYRASKAEALEEADAAELDLFASMMVKVDRPLPHAHQTKQVRYRVHLEGGDPASVFVTGPDAGGQVDRRPHGRDHGLRHPARPGRTGIRDAPADPPTEDDLRPNSFIQSDDPLIVADAKKAAGGEKDPWRVAVALERYVNREVTNKDYTQAFATAAEVAKSREGDCTEHAVFLGGAGPRPGHPRPRGHRPGLHARASRRSSITCGPRSTSTSAGFRSTARWPWAASGPAI